MKQAGIWATAALLLAVCGGNSASAASGPAATQAGILGSPTRGIIFVHGIGGDARLPGFDALLQPLAERYLDHLESFAFLDDVANRDGTSQRCEA